MTKRPPRDMAASVHQRLLNKAKQAGRPFNELLQYYAMERFLYRLSRTRHADKFVLKGALMFRVWQVQVSRPTKDIDVLGRIRNEPGEVVQVIRDACNQDVESDGIAFDASTAVARRIAEDGDYEGVRVRVLGALGNARVLLQVDVGFGDAVTPPVRMVEYPTILDFPAPRLRGYGRESFVAEKFQAMVALGILNSRMKDFYDVWLLSQQFDFDGPALARAIKRTFARRTTDVPAQPVAFQEAFTRDAVKATQWTAFVKRSRLQDAPTGFAEVVAAVSAFLGPAAEALSQDLPFQKLWNAPGPWR